LSASHDGYQHLAGAPVHRRTVELAGRTLQVRDRVDGGAGQSVIATLMLHPHVRVEAGNDTLFLISEGLRMELLTDATVTQEKACWYPDFGQSHATTRLVLTYGSAPCQGGFTLKPHRTDR